jgi:hypothetical protein
MKKKSKMTARKNVDLKAVPKKGEAGAAGEKRRTPKTNASGRTSGPAYIQT